MIHLTKEVPYMSNFVMVYNIFIAAPDGKNSKEKKEIQKDITAIREAIEEFNNTLWEANMRIRFLCTRWDTSLSDPNMEIQEGINNIAKSCDLLLAVFRNRIGGNGTRKSSRTVQEIESVKENRPVFILKCKLIEKVSEENANEISELNAFISEQEAKKLIYTYSKRASLKREVTKILTSFSQNRIITEKEYFQAADGAEKLGLTHLQMGGVAPTEELKAHISSAKCVKILFTTGQALSKIATDSFKALVRKGGKLQVLMSPPHSDFLEDVTELEKRNDPQSMHSEFDASYNFLKEVADEASKEGCVQVGLSYTLLRQTITLCIDKNNKIWAWITMTMPPFRAAVNSPSFCSIGTETRAQPTTTSTLAEIANLHFDKLWEYAKNRDGIHDLKESMGPDNFDKLEYWKTRLNNARIKTLAAKGHTSNRILIEIAAQHPLKNMEKPGEEFSKRLEAGILLYNQQVKAGKDCKIYVPGSRHRVNTIVDKVSLSEAGKTYLIERGIPEQNIYGEEVNIKYKKDAGVYNSEDECFVAANLWREEQFSELICVCSPEQVSRKALYYIDLGIYPLIYAIPVFDTFHDYVKECLVDLPMVIYRSHGPQTIQKKRNSKQREERRPSINE